MLFEPVELEDNRDKVAVIKLGSRIAVSSSGTSGGTGEVLSVIKILTTAGYHVDAYTKVLDKDEMPTDFDIIDIETHYNDLLSKSYKALIVLNGSVNYFGGLDDPSQTLNYHIINHFSGKVFYILCDCNLMLKQIWPSIEKKDWASKYNKNDILITREDIIYISQPRDVTKTIDIARKYVDVKYCIHFPFEKFPLLTSDFMEYNNNCVYDLLYGGTFRSGRREYDMVKFYFGYDNFNVAMFGKIVKSNFSKAKVGDLKYPEFEKAVAYDQFTTKMNESKATVIIGDKLYKELDDLAQRIYESINAGNVVLIDSSYDYNKRVFNDQTLIDFCYVDNREDVKDRLEKLKDNNFRKQIVDLQRQNTKLDKLSYSISLKEIIERC